MKYERPNITILKADFGLLYGSVPDAGDIGSPSLRTKSVWDEESDNTLFNIKEECYEDKVYE